MDNTANRTLAEVLGATCRAYVQAEGNCRGTVAWWVRARLQSKTIWGQRYFVESDDPTKPGWSDRKRYIATDHFKSNLNKPPETFNPHPKMNQLKTDEGLNKSRILQDILVNDDVMVEYITRGVRSDKADWEPKRVGIMAETEPTGFIGDFSKGDNILGIEKTFTKSRLRRYITLFVVTQKNTTIKHALGLDCTSSDTVYFDPNLGEFQFQHFDKFIDWWGTCFLDREYPYAFGMMEEPYYAFHFCR
jgi:hypothetical protein